ncbi:MAG: LytR C-terminal domain-containing protein [Propionibacteriaceae bacterium]|nr:LytR C-terminal domain-containing protein [Propionibacteriaceae bacterium]
MLTPIVLLALLGFLVWGAWWGYEHLQMTPEKPQAECVMTNVGTELTPPSVTVRVLNGGTSGGLARRTRTYLNSFQFRVIAVGNTEREITNTVIVGSSATDPEVQLLMGFFTGATAEGDGRVDHIVDVLVGSDYATPEDRTAIPVSYPVSGPVCLPPITSTSTTTATASAVPEATEEIIVDDEVTSPTPSESATKKKKK